MEANSLNNLFFQKITNLIQQENCQLRMPHLYINYNPDRNLKYQHSTTLTIVQKIYRKIKCLNLTHHLHLVTTAAQLPQAVTKFLQEIDSQNINYQKNLMLQTQSSEINSQIQTKRQGADKYFCNIIICGDVVYEPQIKTLVQQAITSTNIGMISYINIQYIFITDQQQLINTINKNIWIKNYKRQLAQTQVLQLSPQKIQLQTIKKRQVTPNHTITTIYKSIHIYGTEPYLIGFGINFYHNHINKWIRKQKQYLQCLLVNMIPSKYHLFYTTATLKQQLPMIQKNIQKMSNNVNYIRNIIPTNSFVYQVKYMICYALTCLAKILPLFSTQYTTRDNIIYKKLNNIINIIDDIKQKINTCEKGLQGIISNMNMSKLLQISQIQSAIKYIMGNNICKLGILSYISTIIWLSHIRISHTLPSTNTMTQTQTQQQNQDQLHQEQKRRDLYKQQKTLYIRVTMKYTDIRNLVEQLNELVSLDGYVFLSSFYMVGEFVISNWGQNNEQNQINQQDKNIIQQNIDKVEENIKQIKMEKDIELQQIANEQPQQTQIIIKLVTTLKQITENKNQSINFIQNTTDKNKFYVIIVPFQFFTIQQWQDKKINMVYQGSWNNYEVRQKFLNSIKQDSPQDSQSQKQSRKQPQKQPHITKGQKIFQLTTYLQEKLHLQLPLAPLKDQQYSRLLPLVSLSDLYGEILSTYKRLSMRTKQLCSQKLFALASVFMDEQNYYEALLELLLLEYIYKHFYNNIFQQYKQQAINIAFDEKCTSATYEYKFDKQSDELLTQYSQTCIKIGQCYLKLCQPHKNLQYLMQSISHLPIYYNPDKYLHNASILISTYMKMSKNLNPFIIFSLNLYNRYVKAIYLCGQYDVFQDSVDRMFNILFFDQNNRQWGFYGREIYTSVLLNYAEMLKIKQFQQGNQKNTTCLRKQIWCYQKYKSMITLSDRNKKQNLLTYMDVLRNKSRCHQILSQWYQSLQIYRQIIQILEKQSKKIQPLVSHCQYLIIECKLNQVRCMKELGHFDVSQHLYLKLIQFVGEIISSNVTDNDNQVDGNFFEKITQITKAVYFEFCKFLIQMGNAKVAIEVYNQWIQLYTEGQQYQNIYQWI